MPLKVAVVGSGIAAASTCYFLKKQFGDEVQIDVYEKSARVGGRTESITVDGNNMELGAGVAYSGNRYMTNWTKEFGLVANKPRKNTFGLWNGEEFVFKESEAGALTAVKIVERYGSDLLKLRSVIFSTIDKFNKIYRLQDEGVCFETPGDLWRSVDLHDLTQRSFSTAMKSQLSPSSILLPELLFAVNKVNYNQNNDINALAGLVSMCPLVTGDVFNLNSGWTSIHKAIFKGVNKLHLSTPITKICSLPSSDGRSASYKYSVESVNERKGVYDAVVLTCPPDGVDDEKGGVDIILDGEAVKSCMKNTHNVTYQTTHTTFVKGRMNPAYFLKKCSETSGSSRSSSHSFLSTTMLLLFGRSYEDPTTLPQSVYLVEEGAKQEKFSSYSKYFDYKSCSKDHSLYKVFSPEPLEVVTLQNLFTSDSSVVATREWKAYPKFSPPENTCEGFRVKSCQCDVCSTKKSVSNQAEHRIYKTAVLEGCVAALEISAISGRNVSLLLQRDISNSKH